MRGKKQREFRMKSLAVATAFVVWSSSALAELPEIVVTIA
jgi:hypothetical protein